ncbi:hypothetical protein HLB23_27625 [Nocardia uniformis]|uniref:Uncharacterized protein n=1 Tax=Nocardia uniformis TaxID=53432 RepID=A0A849CE76_9NOCA|nr:hypothetical protein [Nocardia uniformis]NNH73579.1 hypothetical protein [Nocardia uniformis]
MEELRDAADRFALGELYSEDLPMIASQALARGLDSPALVELACLHRSDCRDAAELFLTALRELDLIDAIESNWSAREADVLLRRARDHARRLLDGGGNLLAAAGHIAALLHQIGHTLEPFDPGLAELASDFEILTVYGDDGYGDPESIEADIRHACRNLLAGPPFEPVFQRSDNQSAVAESVSVVRTGPRRFWQRLSPRRWRSVRSR